MSSSAGAIAALSALNVLAPSLPWASVAGHDVDLYRAFAASDGVVVFLPRLVGAVVAIPAAIVVCGDRRSPRRGVWIVAALALCGQIVLSLQGIATGRQLATSARAIGSLKIGWYVELAVVLLGAATVVVGVIALASLGRDGADRGSRSPRTSVVTASVALGVGVVWLLSQDVLFVSRLPWAELSPRPSAAVMVASWTVIVVGVTAPVLSVALARDRSVALGLVCGWLAFLAVPWTEAVMTRRGLPGNPTPWGFWLGTALALGGATALIRWTLAPTRSGRSRGTPPPISSGHEWLPRTDEDPLRR